MTQTQINYFLAAASAGSVTRTANRLYVSQPSVSKSITSLERELGFPLFSRQNNAIVLTPAGQQMYDFFARSREEYRQLVSGLQRSCGQLSTQLRVGCPATWNPEAFCGKLTEHFARLCPSIQLRVDGCTPADLLSMLKSRQLDAALTYELQAVSHPGLQMRRLASVGCLLLYARKYFSDVRTVSDFRDTDFLVYNTGLRPYYEGRIRAACGGAFAPRIRNCGNYSTAVFELTRGKGVMFFEDWDSIAASELFGALRLPATVPLVALTPEGCSNPYVELFCDAVAQLFSASGPPGNEPI